MLTESFLEGEDGRKRGGGGYREIKYGLILELK